MRHKFNVGDKVRCGDCKSRNCKVEEVRIEGFGNYIVYLVGNDRCGGFTEEDKLELVEWK